MRAARNKDTLRRLILEVDAGNLDIIEELYHPDYVDHSASMMRETHDGRVGLLRGFRRMQAAFPDVRHTIHHLVAEGDLVVARLSATGTQTGPLADVPATGRSVTLTSTAIYRFEEGRIAERWCDHAPSVLETVRAAVDFDSAPGA